MDTLLGKTKDELTQLAVGLGLPRFAGKQLAEWIYTKRATAFSQMTNLSATARSLLAGNYAIGRKEPIAEAISADGTKKYLFEVQNEDKKWYIESVYIPDNDRATLCVSTQAGCKMGCRFCMTGTLGFQTQLTATDILNQIFSIPDADKLTNIVFMGEGEPGDNTDNVTTAVNALTSNWGCAWSPRRITISSVGFLPGLKRLIEDTECHIAISLHNPFHQEREALMPVEKIYPLSDVIELLHQYDWQHQRRLSFEYICFEGQNDSLRHANALRRLLSGLSCRVNLIKYHTAPADNIAAEKQVRLKSSSTSQMEWMRDYLSNNGIITTIRRSRGEDILAACGMLVNTYGGKTS